MVTYLCLPHRTLVPAPPHTHTYCTYRSSKSPSKPGSPHVTSHHAPPHAPPASNGDYGSNGAAAGPADDEPSEEDVARAFSVYDTDGTGEISTLSLDGASAVLCCGLCCAVGCTVLRAVLDGAWVHNGARVDWVEWGARLVPQSGTGGVGGAEGLSGCVAWAVGGRAGGALPPASPAWPARWDHAPSS